MWLFTTFGFFSIVQKGCGTDEVQVRARRRSDLEALRERLPGPREIVETPWADYRYRLVVTKRELGRIVAQAIGDIDYPNFKEAVRAGGGDAARMSAYHRVWGALLGLQPDQRLPGPDEQALLPMLETEARGRKERQ